MIGSMTVGTNINGMGRPHGEVGQLVFASEALYAQLRWAITYSMRSLEVIGDYDLRFPFSCHQVQLNGLLLWSKAKGGTVLRRWS